MPDREQERAALLRVIETYPSYLDLPTVLWGASAVLLALRDGHDPAARYDPPAGPPPIYKMAPGGGSRSDDPPAPPPAAAEAPPMDERLCLTHRTARWACASLQGPAEFCISVVPCQGCGDTEMHYHTSDGQSHEGSLIP